MIYLGTDHTGFEIKNKVKSFLISKGYEVKDCGAFEFDKDDDYPDFISKAARGVSENPNNLGIIFGGSGQGEAIVANKFPNVRCALFYSQSVPIGAADISGRESSDPFEMLKLTKEHNQSNMLSIGVRFLKEEDVLKAIQIWLEAPAASEERHLRRIDKIKKIEQSR
jgi:ribose 5-phosphate isomerase B